MRYPGFPLKISPPPSERLYDAVRKGCVQMKNELHDADAGPFEKLLLDIARVHHWTGLYAPGHPILAGRIDALRGSLSGEARLNLSEATIRDIGLAALLHDIGKELVPAEILNKPEKLDPLEFAKISLHPVLGATHLRKISLGSDLPVIVCYEHHIRHDRSGYPTPRFEDVPHPASLMTQIADVYDALRTYRPYRASLDRETALGILREGRGTEFEPILLDRFLRMVS